MSSVTLFLAVSVFWLCFNTSAQAQSNTSLWTSWIPLAVRSPYLSTWMDTTNVPFNISDVDDVDRAPTVWPQFLQSQVFTSQWTATLLAQVLLQIIGWAGLIRIDQRQTFTWLGDPGAPSGLHRSILTNIEITPTRTIMNMTAGPLDLTVAFLSPIEVCADM